MRRPEVISVLSNQLEPLGIIDQFAGLTVTVGFFSAGSFEIKLSGASAGRALLQVDQIMDFGQNGTVAGIIEGVESVLTATGVQTRVYGPLLNGLMKRRVVVFTDDPELYGWDVAAGTAGSIMAHYVHNHVIAPKHAARAIPNFRTAPGIEYVGLETVAKSKFDKLYDVLEQLGQFTSCGWRIALDGDWYEFQAMETVDRTTDSDAPFILSTTFGNVSGATASTDRMEYANAVYALGDGQYGERLYQVYYPDDEIMTGWNRTEAVADCGNETSILRLRDLALQKVADLEKTDSITVQLIAGQGEINAGDMVTVNMPEIGAVYDLLVAEASYNWAGAKSGVTVTLGRPPRTLTSKLERVRRLSGIT